MDEDDDPRQIPIHTAEDFAGMHKAGALAARILDEITPFVQPGVTTASLDQRIAEMVQDAGAVAATLGYQGPPGVMPYPASSCISLNHVVCHGIPSDKKLADGDILNIDVTPIVDGWHGDTSRMYLVGDVPIKAQRLVDVTYECLMRGIAVVRPGATTGDIGHAIQTHAESHRFSVVRQFVGHGLGRKFHTAPQVKHFGRPGEGTVLKAGMFFTIEPMINAGGWGVKTLRDGWTAVTRDRSLSAQFEHSIGVTETGYEIFTASPAGYTRPPYVASASVAASG